MRIKKKLFDAKWFDFSDKVRLLIRPFANIEGLYIKPDNIEDLTKLSWNRFNYCLINWEGIIDCSCNEEEDKCKCPKMECTEENKRSLFNIWDALIVFVTNKDIELKYEIHNELKN